MSLAACEERCARLRTSVATTAKPRPASPARAASTAALSARRLVCRAISSMTPMMSAILRDEPSIRDMASTACATTPPLWLATSRVLAACWLACRAFAALLLVPALLLGGLMALLLDQQALLIGLLFQPFALQRCVVEHRDGAAHRGDFVVGLDRRQLELGVARRQSAHAVVDRGQRLHQLALDIEHADAGGGQNRGQRNQQ